MVMQPAQRRGRRNERRVLLRNEQPRLSVDEHLAQGQHAPGAPRAAGCRVPAATAEQRRHLQQVPQECRVGRGVAVEALGSAHVVPAVQFDVAGSGSLRQTPALPPQHALQLPAQSDAAGAAVAVTAVGTRALLFVVPRPRGLVAAVAVSVALVLPISVQHRPVAVGKTRGCALAVAHAAGGAVVDLAVGGVAAVLAREVFAARQELVDAHGRGPHLGVGVVCS